MKQSKIIKRLVIISVLLIFVLFNNISKAEIEETKDEVMNDSDISYSEDSKEELEDSTIDFEEEFKEIITHQKLQEVIDETNTLLKENEKETGKPSPSRYPNAGLETNIFVPIIEVLIGLLVVSLIFMIIKVKKNKKN